MKSSYGEELQNICHVLQKAKGPEASWELLPDRALQWASQGDEGKGLGWLDRHLCLTVTQQCHFLLPLLTQFLPELTIQITKQPSHQLWSPEITPAWGPCPNCNPHRADFCHSMAVPASFQHVHRERLAFWHPFLQGICLAVVGLLWKWLNKSPWSNARLKICWVQLSMTSETAVSL